MGSTVAAVLFGQDTLIAANIGDSPIYLIRNGKIDLLSVPHTLRAEALGEPDVLPAANILTRAVGTRAAVEADLCELSCYKDDVLVLCSDGLSTKVSAIGNHVSSLPRDGRPGPPAGRWWTWPMNAAGRTTYPPWWCGLGLRCAAGGFR